MRHYLIIFTALTFSIISSIKEASAWGENGHRITAEIGERNIKPHTRSVIASIIQAETLAEIATWPDDIRSDSSWNISHPWHFFSINDDESWRNVPRDPNGDVLSALEALEAFLMDPNMESVNLTGTLIKDIRESALKEEQQKTISKREALAFYIHFIGDIHQPLHVGRREDFGGNKIAVTWFGEDTNLHKVWDELLIKSRSLSFTELSTFLNRVPEQQRQAWNNSTYLDWAKESKTIRDQVYDFGKQKPPYYLNVTAAPVLKWEYRGNALEIVNERLVKGGIRLAGKLDEIFSGYSE